MMHRFAGFWVILRREKVFAHSELFDWAGHAGGLLQTN